ncbi:MAG: helix-hairpin-helix domain-containing protein [Pseudomonadota bacterium]|nr:helix-hairpin-helix domain-containing protein [Pseudomonadota bacterium]MDP1903266.1 helix-hairpin-helix domain-containing protein [Pseudomonadota bacterium]MDP2351216.1 helix-hairpin-helix domain-containing protein [Pseudomonadota bacterium]
MKKAKTAVAALELEALPNIGPVVAGYLRQVGIHVPADLKGQDPYVLYQQLCAQTGVMHDPCLLDTFIAATRFMAGEPPLPWWRYTKERKRTFKAS